MPTSAPGGEAPTALSFDECMQILRLYDFDNPANSAIIDETISPELYYEVFTSELYENWIRVHHPATSKPSTEERHRLWIHDGLYSDRSGITRVIFQTLRKVVKRDVSYKVLYSHYDRYDTRTNIASAILRHCTAAFVARCL
jgi:hypothetical protein